MGRMNGKVALITGAARGQGRAHAVRLAAEGANVVALDLCAPLPGSPYEGADLSELNETIRLVEEQGQQGLAVQADIRDLASLERAVEQTMATFGRLDTVVANAAVQHFGLTWQLTEAEWSNVIDTNLTGAWKTVKATVPAMLEQGEGGSIILISSIGGLIGIPTTSHYCAAKHGVTGLMRTLALELAQQSIRVNSIHSAAVQTPMLDNEAAYSMFLGVAAGGTRDRAIAPLTNLNALPIPWIEAEDISNAVLFLASDESRCITGTTQVVDAGSTHPFKIPHA